MEHLVNDGNREPLRHAIEAMESSLDQNIGRVFKDAPFQLNVEGFQPDVSSVAYIELALAPEFNDACIATGDVTTIDFSCVYPGEGYHSENVDCLTVHWDSGCSYIVKAMHDTQGIKYLGLGCKDGKPVTKPLALKTNDAEALLGAAGIPEELINANEDMSSLVPGLLKKSSRIGIRQELHLPVDIDTGLRLIRDVECKPITKKMSRSCLDYSLTASFWNYHDSDDDYAMREHLNVPTALPMYANNFAFQLDPSDERWHYYGFYQGPVVAGELIDEFVEKADVLGLPQLAYSEKLVRSLGDRVMPGRP